jgi:hypothetical protein
MEERNAPSLLRRLATHRVASGEVVVRYDPISQTTRVFEDGQWVQSWESNVLSKTKKADLETGEDQKGE